MASYNKLTILLLSLVILTSCRTRIDTEEFSDQIQAVLTKSNKKPKPGNIAGTMYDAYSKHSFGPIWTDEKGSVKKGEELIEELSGLWADGLDTSRYGIARLSEVLQNLAKHYFHTHHLLVVFCQVQLHQWYINCYVCRRQFLW